MIIGLRANQKPTSTPASEPITNASIASISVIHRCFQIVPSTNHFTMREATSSGVEKKNGGKRVTQFFSAPKYDRPHTGYWVSTCHSAIDTTATRIWRVRSVTRDIVHPPPV